MLQQILHSLVFYLLKKSTFERIILFCLFISCLLVVVSSIKNEEWITKTRKQVDVASVQNDIVSLFKEYKIQSKCAKTICTNKELQRNRLQTTLPYTEKHYTLFFTCHGMLCYDFVRYLEELPTLFIHEIASSNATIIKNLQGDNAHAQDSSDNEAQIEWKQDMYIVFSIGTY